MGSLLQNTIFGRSKYTANTFIGGVSSTLNNPTLVAAKLGIATNRIKVFKIIDNDIEFAVIGGNYVINGFTSNTNVTYYEDPLGLVTRIGISAFQNCINLTKINLPNLSWISSGGLSGTSLTGIFNFDKLIKIDNTGMTSMRGNCIINIPSLDPVTTGLNCFSGGVNSVTINVPLSFKTSNSGLPHSSMTISGGSQILNYIGYIESNSYNTSIGYNNSEALTNFPNKGIFAQKMGTSSGNIVDYKIENNQIKYSALTQYRTVSSVFRNDINITYFDDSSPGFITFMDNTFQNAPNIVSIKAYGLVETLANFINGNTNLETVDLPNWTISNTTLFLNNCTKVNFLNISNLTYIKSVSVRNHFAGAPINKTIYMPKLVQCGATTTNDNVFSFLPDGCTIIVNQLLKTINAGNPDDDLVYAANVKSASIIYV